MKTQNDATSEILALMRAGANHSFEVRVRQAKFKLRVLTAHEVIQCARETLDRVNELKEDSAVSEAIISASIKLEKASTPEGGGMPTLPGALLSAMTTDEIDSLYSQWLAEISKANPSMEEIPTEQLLALVDEVKKNPSEALITLSSRSFGELVNLSRHLILRE